MFNIQLFADTISSDDILALGFKRSDDSIQYIKLQNPKSNLTESEVKTAMQYLTDNSILLDSKDNTVFTSTSIYTAYTQTTTTQNLDIG